MAIDLELEAYEVEAYQDQYWRLRNLNDLIALHKAVGPKLPDFLAAFNNLTSKGFTIDQAIDLRNLSSTASELKREMNTLSFEKRSIMTQLFQMHHLKGELNDQLDNSKYELFKMRQNVKQLRQEYQDLNDMVVNFIMREKVTFQNINGIVKEHMNLITRNHFHYHGE